MIITAREMATMGANVVFHAVGVALEQWFAPYLDLTWWMGHPVWSVIALVVLLVITQAFLGLVSHLIKQLLLVLVKSPYLLLQWLLKYAAAQLKMPVPDRLLQPTQAKGGTDLSQPVHGQILTILQQLVQTQQEQDRLLQDLQHLLNTDSLSRSSASTDANIVPAPK